MDEKIGRYHNAKLNTVWAIICQLVFIVLGFLNRKVFYNFLGAELLGVNSLFSDVLIIFSLADMGFSTAIMFSMYKPIAENDTQKVCSLLLFYRCIYRYVIIALIIISICFIPFLRFIKTDIPFSDLLVYYMFFQANNLVEYVWVYRESYIIACQKERELSKWNIIFYVTKNMSQILTVIFFKNFIAYLFVGFACLTIKKVFVNNYILIHYPITSIEKANQLSDNEKQSIVRKSKALLVTKVGNLIINQTDSLIISYIISVAQWGLASNYILIKKSIFTISEKIYSSVLPSMGNLIVKSDKGHKTKIFLQYDFLNAWMQTFFFVSFLCLSNPFISLFFGNEAILPFYFVFVFFFASFIDGLRNPVSVMREAGGSFEKDKWYTVVAALVNMAVSIPLAIKIGMVGVYVGTICSMLILHLFRTIVLLGDNSFDITVYKYLELILKHVFFALIIGAVTFVLVQLTYKINTNLYAIFLIQCLTVVIIPNLIWIFINYDNQIFQDVQLRVKIIKWGKNK